MLEQHDYEVKSFSLKTKKRVFFGKWKDIAPEKSKLYDEYVRIKKFVKEIDENNSRVKTNLTFALIIGLSLKGFNILRKENQINLVRSKRDEMLELVIFVNKVSRT